MSEEKRSDRWARFWFLEVDALVLGLYRLALGLFVLFWLISLAPNLMEYYGPKGIALERLRSTAQLNTLSSPILRLQSEAGVWMFYAVSVASAALFTAGVFVRGTTVWLWLTIVWLTFTNRFVVNGEEQVLALLLFFSIGAPLDAALSFKQLRAPGGLRRAIFEPKRVPMWGLRALELHMMIVYLVSFPSKPTSGVPGDRPWLLGTTVYYATRTLEYPRWLGLNFATWFGGWSSKLLTWSTLVAELALPVMYFFRRTKLIALLGLIGLHVGMGLILSGVMMFNGAMLAGLILLLPPEPVRALAQRIYAICKRDG